MNEELKVKGETKEEKSTIKKSKFFQSDRHLRLQWGRFRFTGEWIFYFYYFLFSVMSVIVFVSIMEFIVKEEDKESALTWLIPLILAFQLIFIIVQTVNQNRHNKIMKMGVVPSLSIYGERIEFTVGRRRQVREYWSMKLLNLGTDAHNVRYTIKEDGEYVKSDLPYFLLRREKPEEIYKYPNKSDFLEKQIEIKVGFEDMVRSPRYHAYFKKDAKEKEFRTISTGIR